MHRVLGLPGIARLFRQDRPAWCKEKEYPTIKVPSLEHNNEVKGVSLDLIKCIDSHFDGLSFLPHDPAKKEFAAELFSCSGSFSKSINSTFKGEADEAGDEQNLGLQPSQAQSKAGRRNLQETLCGHKKDVIITLHLTGV
ncbi:hypothetical protein Peur_054266 [Populus x canadensis]